MLELLPGYDGWKTSEDAPEPPCADCGKRGRGDVYPFEGQAWHAACAPALEVHAVALGGYDRAAVKEAKTIIEAWATLAAEHLR